MLFPEAEPERVTDEFEFLKDDVLLLLSRAVYSPEGTLLEVALYVRG